MRNRLAARIAKIVFLLLLILSLAIGGIVWLDFIGVINAKPRISAVLAWTGFKRFQEIDSPVIPLSLDSDRMEKEREAIAVARRQLEKDVEDFSLKEDLLVQKENELLEREKMVEEQQKSLSEAMNIYDNKIANLEQTARYVMGMPPEDAVAIMDQYDIRDLVDLLRTSERLSQEDDEESLVAYWLSLMQDRNRAAEIQRLLVEKPGLNLDG